MEKENCKKNKTTNKGMIRITYEFPVELLDKVPLPEGSTPSQEWALASAIGALKIMGEGREILLSSEKPHVEEFLLHISPTLCCQAATKILHDYKEEAREAKVAILSCALDIGQRLTRQNNEGDN